MILHKSYRYAMGRLKLQPGRFWAGKSPADYVESDRMLYDYELIFFRSGRARMIIGGESAYCHPGVILIIPPAVGHHLAMEEAGERWCIHFDWYGDCRAHWVEGSPSVVEVDPEQPFDRRLCAAPPPAELGLTFPMRCELSPEKAEEMFELMRLYFMGGEMVTLADAFERSSYLLRILSIAFATAPDHPRIRHKRYSVRFARAKGILDAHFQKAGLTLEQVARDLQITPNHLSKLFRSELGISALEYLQGCRLRHACGLLRDTMLTIQEIALDSGFGTANYFIRFFRGQMGMTPLAYRRQKLK